MFADLEEYALARHQVVEWLSPLPEHWGAARGKTLFRREKREPLPDDGVVTCFRDGAVTLRSNRRVTGFTEAVQEHGYQRILKGDLVIHAMDAFAGAVGVSDSDGKSSPVYAACTPRASANADYYAHVVREMARTGWIAALSRGVRERSTDFRFESFAAQNLPVPPLDEQEAIVKYLKHAHGRIDRVVASKRKLIALLDEQRRAITHRAVTRGLDPDVTLEESGVPWLGKIPTHWDLAPTRAALKLAKTVVGEAHGDHVLLSLTLGGVVVRDLSRSKGKFASDQSTYQLVAAGQFVFCLFDVDETPRTVGLSRVDGMITGAYRVFDCPDRELAEFTELYFLAMDDGKYLRPLYTGLRKTIPIGPFLQSKMPFPPPAERARIVAEVRAQSSAINDLKARAVREIELLREYRARLTSDVVTGRVDVRKIARTLPEVEGGKSSNLDDALDVEELESAIADG